jgi:hypothetical protein
MTSGKSKDIAAEAVCATATMPIAQAIASNAFEILLSLLIISLSSKVGQKQANSSNTLARASVKQY